MNDDAEPVFLGWFCNGNGKSFGLHLDRGYLETL